MAVKGGLKIAIAAPLLLLAAAGLIAVFRQADPPVVPKSPPKPATVRPAVVPPATTPAPPPAGAPPVPKPTGRKPYPLALPSDNASEAARETWRRIAEARLSIDCQNESIDLILRSLAVKLGVTLMLQLPAESLGQVTFKVMDLNGDGCLRILLTPRRLGYEIRPDGAVFVGPADQISGGYEKLGQENYQLQMEVNLIHQELERGWDGIRDATDLRDASDRVLRTKRVFLPQGTTTWLKVVELLNEEHGGSVHLDTTASPAVKEACRRPFLSVVEESTMGAVVERLARELSLSWCVLENGTVYVSSEAEVATWRAAAAARATGHQRDVDRLQQPVTETGPMSVPDLLDSIARTQGVRVMPEEPVWESAATVTVAAGSTLRQALDQLKPLGFRWAVRNGSLYVVR
jgi:hypothetical protein